MKFIENVEINRYREFESNHKKSHFLQSYEWGLFCKRAKGQVPCYVGMEDENGNLVATCLILLRKTPFGFSYGYAPRGFILDYNNKDVIKVFTTYLKEYMKNNKIIYIKFDPDIKYQDIDENGNKIDGGENNYELYDYMLSLGYKHTGFYRLYEGNQPRYTFRINLKKSWEEIEAKFNKSFMKSVKRSYSYNLIVDNDVKVDDFYRLLQSNSSKDDFDPHSLEYYKIFSEEMSKDNNMKYFNISIRPKELLENISKEIDALNKELEVSKKKEADIKNKVSRLEREKEVFSKIDKAEVCICSLICTYTKTHAWSLYIGSDDLANFTFAVTRSYYEAIKDAYNNGYEFFDLFGTPGDPNTKYKNLAKLHDFKRKFGDEYIEFIGEFDLVNNKLLYKMLPIMLKVYRKLRRK
jgi:peptidoglycan pentaglycine glycine transferase (the first glycine)